MLTLVSWIILKIICFCKINGVILFFTLIEKATDGKSMSENWNLILDICDKVGGSSATNAKECLKSIVKRLNNPDPHIIMHALTVSIPLFPFFILTTLGVFLMS